MKSLPRLSYSGGVDADGHVLEAPDLWDRYMDPAYRDRALRIRKDANGKEYLEIDGRPSKLIRAGMPEGTGAMDRVAGIVYEREKKTGLAYVDNAPLGGMDPVERIQLDLENLERAFLYPTLGVLWVAECEDEDLTQAYVRAYNLEQQPELRVVVLESGAGWLAYWLDRMDAVWASPQGMRVRQVLPERPSSYFRRQCWISGDPDETSLAAIMPIVGEDRFFWASDFPHPDHPPDYVENLERLVAPLAEEARAGLLGRNVLRAYRMED